MHAGRVWALTLLVALTGCATDDFEVSSTQEYTRPVIVRNNLRMPPSSAFAINNIAPAAGRATQPVRAALAIEGGPPPGHCSLKDRFDRKEAIAYNFSDGQSRVGLRLGIDGFSLSDAGNFELEEVKINFRYRFQPIKKKREHCLYASSWQGLAGSAYNELVLRETHTVYEELDDKWDEVGDGIDKLFDD